MYWSPLLATCVVLVAAQPAPFVVPPTLQWDGVDGLWSTFQLQVGSPYQQVRLLPATSGSTFAPFGRQGCAQDPNPNSCANAHGGVYNSNGSSSYTVLGNFAYALPTNLNGQLGDNASATYGLDNVRFAWPGSPAPTVNGTVIAALTEDNMDFYYFGQFGLTPHTTNLSSLVDTHPTVLQSLKDSKQIPSLSWGYTAGCHNRDPPAFGSLTLGGYDLSKFRPTDITFPFPRDGGDIVAGLQRISVDSTGTDLLPNPIYINIDSQVSSIILPREACQQFERAFNLTYMPVTNPDTGFYLLDDNQHQALLRMNPSITFSLGVALAGGSTVDITLPYSAFDLAYTPPLAPTSQRYFPLKQATNSSQYVLGRTFLQYAYLTADFERSNFSIAPALFAQNAPQQLQAISSPGNGGSSGSSGGLSGGAIAGIVIGVIAGLAIIGALVAFFLIRRRRRSRTAAAELAAPPTWQTPGTAQSEFSDQPPSAMSPTAMSEHPYWGNVYNKVELGGDAKQGPTEGRGELPAPDKSDAARFQELEAQQRHEMGASDTLASEVKQKTETYELDGSTPVPAEMAERRQE